MDKKEEEFLKKLLSIFKIEANEHVKSITSGIIELEKAAERNEPGPIETVYREAHSLKGAARSVNLTEVEKICQSMENVFAALKRKEITTSGEVFDILHESIDFISGLLANEGKISDSEKSYLKDLVERLDYTSKGGMLSHKTKVDIQKPEAKPKEEKQSELLEEKRKPPIDILSEIVIKPIGVKKQTEEKQEDTQKTKFQVPSPTMSDTVRISRAKLDALLLQAEELLSVKLTAKQHSSELNEINKSFELWKKEWAKVSSNVQRVQKLLEKKEQQNIDISHYAKMIDFFEKNNEFINSQESKLKAMAKSAEYDQRSLGGMVNVLLDDMKKVLMLPFSSLLEIFPKLVRDLSHDQNKDIELVIKGEEIEIDRRILEEMKDPLIHIVRNCIDHGIEKPDERKFKNKPQRGTLKLEITAKEGNKIEIVVSDDGAGIDVSKVKASALRRGIITNDEAKKMNEQEAISLIFTSGVSTSSIITDISGRGLGLAIVREKVEKLNGVVFVETKIDVMTCFRIVVPLTLATFRGLLVHVNNYLFVLPTTNIDCVVRINKSNIKTVENRETVSINGDAVSLVNLASILELQDIITENNKDVILTVVLSSSDKKIAFIVDEVLHEQEVLVKSLGKQLSRVRNIAGATVLGNGKVVPILNVHDLIKSGVKTSSNFSLKTSSKANAKSKLKKNSILVVEDSITSRTLIKNILESAGYSVKIAVDGVDAITSLKTYDFDLVVSDVEMPRMGGFELTEKIRNDKKYSELPVIIVTSLDSREDKERGIAVGANAYIVKSNFDQSNLLEIIGRFL